MTKSEALKKLDKALGELSEANHILEEVANDAGEWPKGVMQDAKGCISAAMFVLRYWMSQSTKDDPLLRRMVRRKNRLEELKVPDRRQPKK